MGGEGAHIGRGVCSPLRRLQHPCEHAASQQLVLPSLIFYPLTLVPCSEPGPGAMEIDEAPFPPSRRS